MIAHRGDSHDHAEHTLEAYVQAIAKGADGVECDVRLTADGHLVCVHDRDLRRTANHRGLVSTMTLTELNRLDFSAWKRSWADDEAPETVGPRGGVLTLRTLLQTVAAGPRRVEVAIETKHPTRYGGLVERRLIEVLGEFGWTGPDSPVRVMSFSVSAVTRIRRLAPDLRVVMLVDQAARWPLLRRVVGSSWIIGPGIDELQENPRFGARLVAEGREVHVWTVNSEEQLRTCLELGVRAVITDRPALMLDLLARR